MWPRAAPGSLLLCRRRPRSLVLDRAGCSAPFAFYFCGSGFPPGPALPCDWAHVGRWFTWPLLVASPPRLDLSSEVFQLPCPLRGALAGCGVPACADPSRGRPARLCPVWGFSARPPPVMVTSLSLWMLLRSKFETGTSRNAINWGETARRMGGDLRAPCPMGLVSRAVKASYESELWVPGCW